MEFQKIKVTKQNTLDVTYKDEDGNIVQFTGANVVHKDLRKAMEALTPHFAIVTEQREAYNVTMNTLKAQKITDEGENNIYKRLTVDGVSFSNGEKRVSLTGTRLLMKAGVISLTSPTVNLEDDEDYLYHNELDIDIEAVKYEAKTYIEEKKWGVKQSEIDFKDIDPYENVEAGDVPDAGTQAPKKRGRKPKKVA